MKIKFKHYCLLCLLLITAMGYAQQDTDRWKALFALGINTPSQNGLVEPFVADTNNFPTINLGVQRMFTPLLGAKIDFGYNRFTNVKNTPDFKVNYTRFNAQVVVNTTKLLPFLPVGIGLVFHAGPGYTMIKPLDAYTSNKTAYFNAMAGLELHYKFTQTLSVFVDGSYIYGFAKEFNSIIDGAGSFNGDLFTITLGAAVSLSGCRTCN